MSRSGPRPSGDRTVVGTRKAVRSPVPRWPDEPSPHVTTVPSLRSAMEKSVLALTATTPSSRPGRPSAARTGTGTALSRVVPSPS